MKRKKYNNIVSSVLDNITYNKLLKQSEKENRTVSQMVREILKKEVGKNVLSNI